MKTFSKPLVTCTIWTIPRNSYRKFSRYLYWLQNYVRSSQLIYNNKLVSFILKILFNGLINKFTRDTEPKNMKKLRVRFSLFFEG